MVSGPESKGDPGPGVSKISVLIPGQELHLYVVPAPSSNQSFISDVHLGPHLGPGVLLGHIHIHRLESIIHSLQEMSLPLPGVSVLILGDESQHPHLAGLVPGSQAPQEFILRWAAIGDLLVFQVLLLHEVICDELPQIAKEWVPHPEGKEKNA